MAQDEGRFGRINDPKRAWAPPRMRPRAPKQVVREYLHAFVAVCPAMGKLSALILPFVNTDMMNLFLAQVSTDFKEYFLIMLTDRARWHTSKELRVPENIRLVLQPAYSPELNSAEHIWDELRENDFHNQVLDSLDRVEDVLCTGLNSLANDSARLKSLTNFPYLNVTDLNAT